MRRWQMATYALAVLLQAQAQDSTSTRLVVADTTAPANNAIYLEGWGVSSTASVNYERTMPLTRRISTSARIGVGSIHLRDFTRRFNPDLIVPFGLYGAFDLRKLLVEAGGGGAFTSIVYPDPNSFDPSRTQRVHGWFSAGVKTRNRKGNVFVRAAMNWIFEFGRTDRTFGVGIGYQF